MASKNCPATDIRTLKWDYSLPEFIKLQEYVNIMDDVEQAVHKDQKVKQKSNQKK